MTKFYDTSSLLCLADEDLMAEHFFISSITLKELEEIKSNPNKPSDIKYNARRVVRFLDANQDMYTVVICDDPIYKRLAEKYFMPATNDNLILCCATMCTVDVVCSEDFCMRTIGRLVFDLPMGSVQVKEKQPDYTGYKQVQMSDSEYAQFLNSLEDNEFGCLVNEYLIVYDNEFDLFDCFRWTGERFEPAYNKAVKSISMGDKIKPKDEFQRCAIDSMVNNQLTVLTGKAGSGKSLMALATCMNLIDSHKYDTLVILFNPTSARGAARLGFYAGDLNSKCKQSSIGHILNSKFGDPMIVDSLIASGRIRLVPMADARGLEIDDHSILWITEAQNTSADLMKLCLTRIGSGAKAFIEGDYNSQVDDASFTGEDNGLKRLIEVFKGEDMFGCVNLPNVHRSRIAEIADKM